MGAGTSKVMLDAFKVQMKQEVSPEFQRTMNSWGLDFLQMQIAAIVFHLFGWAKTSYMFLFLAAVVFIRIQMKSYAYLTK